MNFRLMIWTFIVAVILVVASVFLKRAMFELLTPLLAIGVVGFLLYTFLLSFKKDSKVEENAEVDKEDKVL